MWSCEGCSGSCYETCHGTCHDSCFLICGGCDGNCNDVCTGTESIETLTPLEETNHTNEK